MRLPTRPHLQILLSQKSCELRSNCSPRKVSLVGNLTALRKFRAVNRVLQNANECCMQSVWLALWHKPYAGLCDWGGSFGASICDEWKPAGNSGDCTAPTRGNRAANKKQHVASIEPLNDLSRVD